MDRQLMLQNFKMVPQRNGLSLHSQLRPLSVLVFHLLLAQSVTGQSPIIGSPQPIVATIGDDIILLCHLEPAVDVAAMTLEWTRPDLDPEFVFVWRFGQDLVHTKHPSYEGRTSVFTDELTKGNISLKLSDVRPSDAGRYRCCILDMNTDSFVELLVGAASSPVISLAGVDRDKAGVVLQCECAGWHPEPEVLWLDGEGKLLSAGHTETVRGPDDLYTVSSRVTVEKRHSNSFTCRVQQRNINQTRETHVYISDDFFKIQSSSSVITGLAVGLAVCILLIVLLLLFLLKLRQKVFKTKRRYYGEIEKGQQMNSSKTDKTEDQSVPVEEREHLMTAETVQVKQRSQQQLLEEQQRREEAEKEVQTLKEELEDKKKEVETKQCELQQLREEKQRNEDELQTVKEELENKNKELESSKTQSIFSSSQRRKEAEKEVETLKMQLETQQMELDTKIKKLEVKEQAAEMEWKKKYDMLMESKHEEINQTKRHVDQLLADVKKLTEEKQRIENERQQLQKEMQKQLQLKEQETQRHMKELADRETEKKLNDERTRREKAERDVEALKKELKTKEAETKRQLEAMISKWTKLQKKLEKQLQDEKDSRKKFGEKVTTLKQQLQNRNTQLQEEHTRRREAKRQLQRKQQELLAEMETKQAETINQLQQLKDSALGEVKDLKDQLQTQRREVSD